MQKRNLLAPVAAFVAAATLSSITPAQSAPPALRTTQTTVTVHVVDGVATTQLSQILRNETARQAEATWILPLPEGAVADGFRMTVNGVEMESEVLGSDGARKIYEEIVRKRRDPGLLEYYGRGCLRARIFPIPANGEVRADVTFRQVLPSAAGLLRWSLALDEAGIGGRPPENVTLDLQLRSRKPIKNVFSPCAAIDVVRKSDHEARASFEGPHAKLEASELAVFYGLSEAEFGLNLLSHRKEGDDLGTFLMLISPKREWADVEIQKKSVLFVLDTSGSMAGTKIDQAREALRFFLGSLRPEDRFNVIPFSTEPRPFFPAAVEADAEHVAQALAKVEGVEARGGTNIAQALFAALEQTAEKGEHVPLVVFLTDGLPTVDVTDPERILAQARERNVGGARLFVLGVGNDVNTRLLDTLAGDGRGTRDYVRENESIEVKASALFTKIESPVLTDLSVTVDGLALAQLAPAKLPDLFRGEQLAVFGRFQGSGQRAIRLSGNVMGTRREYVYEGTFAPGPVAEQAFVTSLWAERRVGLLLDAIRLNGADPELVAEVERLGREFHIVTPYTSHLILEDELRVASDAPGEAFRGPGDSPGARGPTAPGPVGPASPGSRPRSDGASSGGSDAFFLGRGQLRTEREDLDLDEVARRLRDAGVLPPEADGAELNALARAVAQEMRDSQTSLRELGQEETGKKAVDDSQYLASLVAGEGKNLRGKARLLERFTRRAGDKVFRLRHGVWTDRELDQEPLATGARTVVEAYSAEYFALLTRRPELLPFFALSTRLEVRLGNEVFEVVPAKGTSSER